MILTPDGYSIGQPQIEAMCDYPVFDTSTATSRSAKSYVQRFMGSVRFSADFIPSVGVLGT